MCMVLGKGRAKVTVKPIILLNGSCLVVSDTVTYLGHVLTSNGCDAENIVKLYRSLCARANTINIIRKFSGCSEGIRVRLFGAYCSSFYCIALCQTYTKRDMNTLRVCYNNAFRKLLRLRYDCSASQMFLSRGTFTFGELQRKCIDNLQVRLSTTPNTLVGVALNVSKDSILVNRWTSVLYT